MADQPHWLRGNKQTSFISILATQDMSNVVHPMIPNPNVGICEELLKMRKLLPISDAWMKGLPP